MAEIHAETGAENGARNEEWEVGVGSGMSWSGSIQA